MTILFTLLVLVCAEATECRWKTGGHFMNEVPCLEAGGDYALRDPTIMRYKCVARIY